LFEPFFSSESRSSGMGLYICRELCESHGAGIHYQRALRAPDQITLNPQHAATSEGNVFTITLESAGVHCDASPSKSTPVAWRKIT
jgi:two-component system sensor histidine kinase PilS (NtrC family)